MPDRVDRVDQRDRVVVASARARSRQSSKLPSTCTTWAPCTIAWASLPVAIRPGRQQHEQAEAGRVLRTRPPTRRCCPSTRRRRPWRPAPAATLIATVMPRSLNEPVGFAPSTLSQTSQPRSSDSASRRDQRRAPLAQRDHGIGVGDRKPRAIARDHAASRAPETGAFELLGDPPRSVGSLISLTFDSHHAGHVADDVEPAQGASTVALSAASVARWVTITSWASASRPCWRTVWIDTPCSAKHQRDRGEHTRHVGRPRGDR